MTRETPSWIGGYKDGSFEDIARFSQSCEALHCTGDSLSGNLLCAPHNPAFIEVHGSSAGSNSETWEGRRFPAGCYRGISNTNQG